jgi:hypothetical protein
MIGVPRGPVALLRDRFPENSQAIGVRNDTGGELTFNTENSS